MRELRGGRAGREKEMNSCVFAHTYVRVGVDSGMSQSMHGRGKSRIKLRWAAMGPVTYEHEDQGWVDGTRSASSFKCAV